MSFGRSVGIILESVNATDTGLDRQVAKRTRACARARSLSFPCLRRVLK